MAEYISTTATSKILALTKRIRVIAGGTSASKTISVLMQLIDLCQSDEIPTLTSVVSETTPHLKRGAIRDFLNIMQNHGYYDDKRWNKTDFIYTFESGSKLEFFSADQPGKVRGPRRERLFLNEANNVTWEAADQLMVRTKDLIIIDYNPVAEFWVHEEILNNPERDHDFITLTYKDNEALSPEIVQDIEAHRHNKNWWTVYGLGQLGEVEGRIFTGWQAIDEVPHEARLERRGLDFGYSQDPAAIVDVYWYNGGYILDERMYLRNQSNRMLATFLNNIERADVLCVADSAEPKSIDEMREYGSPVIAAQKGPGSLNRSIRHMQDQRISYTKRSLNLAREYRRYYWKKDKDDDTKILDIPEQGDDHLLDAARYALESLRPAEAKEERVPPAPAAAFMY
jgi:phage terminase large subunit